MSNLSAIRFYIGWLLIALLTAKCSVDAVNEWRSDELNSPSGADFEMLDGRAAIDELWKHRPICANEVETLESLPDKYPGDAMYEAALRVFLVSHIVKYAGGWGASLDELPQEEFKPLLPRLYRKARYWKTNRNIFAFNVRGNVVLSREFLSLPSEYRRAVLLHEIAHMHPLLSHLEGQKLEVEVDRIAVCYMRNRFGITGQELFDVLAETSPENMDEDGETHPSHRKRCELVLGAKCGFGSKFPNKWAKFSQ